MKSVRAPGLGATALALLVVGVALVAACEDSAPKQEPTATVAITPGPPAPPDTPTPLPRPTDTATPIAQRIETPEPGALTAGVDEYLSGLVEQRAFSGVVLLAKDGKVVHLKGYGMADAEKGVPNTPDTAFQIGSMTKAFTAASIMLLQEQGRLSVQDPACKYLPNCPPAWQSITIHHLLAHTSGIPNPSAAEWATATKRLLDMSFEQVVDSMRDSALDFAPGSNFAYSNAGYIVLGRIIGQVSGEEYARFVGDHILAPLGMANSSFGPAGPGVPGAANRATGYSEPGKPADVETGPTLGPAGGMFSTAGDIFLWDQALYSEKLLSKASLDAMFTPNLEEYGYGWVISDSAFGKLISHGGQIFGFVATIDRYVDSRSTVIVLSNDEIANIQSIRSELAFLLFKQR